jgi:hypothetical protein
MKLPAFLFLFVSSVTISSAWAGTEAPGARDRSTYRSPSTENVIELQSDEGSGTHGSLPIQVVVPDADTAGTSRSGLAPEPDYLQLVNPAAPMGSYP